jgi:peptide/nickel transport system permease protein
MSAAQRALAAFVARRVVALVATLVVVSAIVFALVHLAPGGPEQSLAGKFATPDQLAAIRSQYGLDRSLPLQFGRFLLHAVQLDVGTSFTTKEKVTAAIGHEIPLTGGLVLVSFLLAGSIGGALGVIAARRKGGAVDRLIVGLAVACAGTPSFVTAIVLVYVFGVRLAWLPVFGTGTGFAGTITHLLIPVATLTLFGLASMLKVTRTRIDQVLSEDHVVFAEARGLAPRRILVNDVLRNSGTQITTQLGIVLLTVLSADILVEMTLNLNGLGSTFVQAVTERDMPLVQGIALLFTAVILVAKLLIDLSHYLVDPRMRGMLAGTSG